MTTDWERRYVRTPKPGSKIGLSAKRKWWVTKPDGTRLKDPVTLDSNVKEHYEARGFTFEAVFK